ncbi:hypothetical protein [Coraliomargarita parva]|uniref:hypothetical protein n=1 Tax=Coraliomargarita parva TaxID=3014050 RepID=UPI0022B3EF9F|nr:hypothetical protein [Coraliomargarita parva]
MKRLIPLLLSVSTIATAQVPNETADYYTLHANEYLGKIVQLWIEDINLVGPHPGASVTEFTSATFDDLELAGTAHILVDTKDAERFYKKYNAPEGYQRVDENEIGTGNRSGWKAQRLKATLIRHDGKLYYYLGRVSPFKDLDGFITLTSHNGRSSQFKVLSVADGKARLQTQSGQTVEVPFSKFNGESQRLLREWQRR